MAGTLRNLLFHFCQLWAVKIFVSMWNLEEQKKSLQSAFFSLHWCIYTTMTVAIASMNLCLSYHLSIMGHICTLGCTIEMVALRHWRRQCILDTLWKLEKWMRCKILDRGTVYLRPNEQMHGIQWFLEYLSINKNVFLCDILFDSYSFIPLRKLDTSPPCHFAPYTLNYYRPYTVSPPY